MYLKGFTPSLAAGLTRTQQQRLESSRLPELWGWLLGLQKDPALGEADRPPENPADRRKEVSMSSVCHNTAGTRVQREFFSQ